ncbi:MAG: hypothetical protein LBT69_03540 [Lactobacillales bacterium]|jgi:hypothetical protein|nr:hypothetical protein [Lactobacillales bacterium]
MDPEDILIKDGIFALPGRKSLQKGDVEYEVILIYSTEVPTERPKNRKHKGQKIKNPKLQQQVSHGEF